MPFPSTSILDNFNRADAPDLGSNWIGLQPGSTLYDNLTILSNRAQHPGYSVGITNLRGNAYSPIPPADQEVYVTLLKGARWHHPSVIYARFDTVNKNGYYLLCNHLATPSNDNFAFQLWRIDGGTDTIIYNAGSGHTADAGGHKIGLKLVGSSIEIWYTLSLAGAWTLETTVTDATYTGSGRLALFGRYDFSDGGAPFDDFGGGGTVPVPPSASGKKAGYVLTIEDPSANKVGFITPDKTGIRRLPRGPGVERQTRRQTSISGGRGAHRHEEDTTRFEDSGNLWSMVEGQITPGPHFGIAALSDMKQNRAVTPVTKWIREDSATSMNGWGGKFTVPAGGYSTYKVSVLLRKKTGVTPDTYMRIRTDSAGVPGTLVDAAQITLTELPDTIATWVTHTFTVDLTAATTYWVVIETGGTGDTFPFEMILNDGLAGARRNTSGVWATHTASPLFYVREVYNDLQIVRMFEYKRGMYMAAYRIGAGQSELYLNGDRGVATGAGQSTTVLEDTTKAWGVNEWAGTVLYCHRGPNISQARKITSNTATTITTDLSDPFPAAHTAGATGSEYVILGSGKWTNINPSPDLGGRCRAVAICNDIVYFAQGDSVNILRMREYNNAGVWTRETAEDGTNKCTLLITAPHWDTGEQSLYAYRQLEIVVQAAKKQPWGTNLTFEATIDAGNRDTFVMGMTLYNNSVWIGKEDSVWVLKNGKFSQVPIAMEAARDLRNGVAIIGWNTNLYYSFLDGLERLYGQVVDDIGPNRDLGLPTNRIGNITHMIPILQYLFCAVDAGRGGYSSILATTSPGGDWHEVFRAIQSGQSITAMHYQTVPETFNRLWFHHGADIFVLYQSDNIYFPANDPDMVVYPESYWVTAWHDLATPELDHYFHEIRVMTGNLQGKIRVEYKVNDDTAAWTAFTANITTVPFGVLAIGDGLVTGRRIKFRFTIEDEGVTGASIVNSVELRANTMNEVIYDYHIDLKIVDKIELMSGGQDYSTDAIEVVNQLEAWKEVAKPLTMRFAAPGGGTIFDNVKGHLDPVSLVIGEWNERNSKLSGNLVFKAIG